MARLLVRLKLALLVGGLRRGWRAVASLLVGVVLVVPAALGVAVGAALLGRLAGPDVADDVLVVAAAALLLGWVVGPLLVFGLDQTLDPARLRLLPLRARALVPGMTAASLVGVGPLACVLVLGGVVVGWVRGGPGAVLVVGGAVALLLLCVVTARLVVTALSGRLASRRGRDALALVGGLVVLAGVLLLQLPNVLVSRAGPDVPLLSDDAVDRLRDGLATASDVVAWTPPGWAARAVVDGRDGDLLTGTGWLLAVVAVTAVAAAGWARVLDDVLATDADVLPAEAGDDVDLVPRLLRPLGDGHVLAVVAKELRYDVRDPKVRASLPMLAVVLLGGAAGAPFLLADGGPRSVLVLPVVAALLGFAANNLLGADRGAFALVVLSSSDPRADLLGRAAALALVGGPMLLLGGVVSAALVDGWALLPAALALAAAVVGVGLGVGCVVSVLAPVRLADGSGNVFSSTTGAGGEQVAVSLVGALASLALLTPVAVLALVPGLVGDGWYLLCAPLAVAYGAAVLVLGARRGGRLLLRRAPEVVEALSAERDPR